jgi:hypothetical protein
LACACSHLPLTPPPPLGQDDDEEEEEEEEEVVVVVVVVVSREASRRQGKPPVAAFASCLISSAFFGLFGCHPHLSHPHTHRDKELVPRLLAMPLRAGVWKMCLRF